MRKYTVKHGQNPLDGRFYFYLKDVTTDRVGTWVTDTENRCIKHTTYEEAQKWIQDQKGLLIER
jgi:hypothetical protein